MPGLQDLTVALPRLYQVFTSAQIKRKYLSKALFNNKDDQCCAILKLENEMTQGSKCRGIQHDYVIEPKFNFQGYPLFSLALLWRT